MICYWFSIHFSLFCLARKKSKIDGTLDKYFHSIQVFMKNGFYYCWKSNQKWRNQEIIVIMLLLKMSLSYHVNIKNYTKTWNVYNICTADCNYFSKVTILMLTNTNVQNVFCTNMWLFAVIFCHQCGFRGFCN